MRQSATFCKGECLRKLGVSETKKCIALMSLLRYTTYNQGIVVYMQKDK